MADRRCHKKPVINHKFSKNPRIPISVRREIFTCRLPKYMVEWLKSQDIPLGRIIERAMLETYHLDPDEIVGIMGSKNLEHYAPTEWNDDDLQELVEACNTAAERLG